MTVQVLYQGLTPSVAVNSGGLFSGKSFWLSKRTPSRASYLGKIQDNGGTISELEDSADFKIADHIKPKFAPAGSVSYQFIDACLRRGALTSSQSHLIHPNNIRPIGSTEQPAKIRRVDFTQEDDRILTKWVLDNETHLAGNKIYQDLSAKHPRHSWQSWRDRYVKGRANWVQLQSRVEPIKDREPSSEPLENQVMPSKPHISPLQKSSAPRETRPKGVRLHAGHRYHEDQPEPSKKLEDAQADRGRGNASSSYRKTTSSPEQNASPLDSELKSEDKDQANDADGERQSGSAFTDEDFNMLLTASKQILDIDSDLLDQAWEEFALVGHARTSHEWRSYWETHVLPVYYQQKRQREIDGNMSSDEENSDEENSDEENSDEENSDEENSDEENSDEENNDEGNNKKENDDKENNDKENNDEENEETLDASERQNDPDSGSEDSRESFETMGNDQGQVAGTTTPPPKANQYILADDGQRHTTTPIRLKNSSLHKRSHEDPSQDVAIPSEERTPLKRRKLAIEEPSSELRSLTPSAKSSVSSEDRTPLKRRKLAIKEASGELNSLTPSAESQDLPGSESHAPFDAYLTAPSTQRGADIAVLDLSNESDRSEEDAGSSEGPAPFQTSRGTSSEQPAIEETLGELESYASGTQDFVDAQLFSEMSAIAQHDEPAQEVQTKVNKPNKPRGRRSNDIKSSSEFSNDEEASYDEDENTSEYGDHEHIKAGSELSIVTHKQTSKVAFAPAAFRTSPNPRPSHRPSLLPPFSSTQSKSKGDSRLENPEYHQSRSPQRSAIATLASQVASQTDSDNDNIVQYIAQWRQAHELDGTPSKLISVAFRSACGDLKLAEQVLDAILVGDSIPTNVRGIWTRVDDNLLHRGGEADLQKLKKKHGRQRVGERADFLEEFDNEDTEI